MGIKYEKSNTLSELAKGVDINKMFLSIFNFKSIYSIDFKMSTIMDLEKSIDRKRAVEELTKYVKYYYIAQEIEVGIFEFTLTREKHFQVLPDILTHIYNDKLYEICLNLDINNKRIDNQTLLPAIMNNRLDPFIISFLNVTQLHPKRFIKELKKQEELRKLKEERPTTDIYTCYNCNARKSIVDQIQIRAGDEPMTLIITCVECYNTYTKG